MAGRRLAITWAPLNVFVFASYLTFTVIFLPSAVLGTATCGLSFEERSNLLSAVAAINEVPFSALLLSTILQASSLWFLLLLGVSVWTGRVVS